MKNIKCILCSEDAELRYVKFPGYKEPDTFQIYHCERCNTAFSYPRVETSEIYENIYKNGDKVPGYDRYWKYFQTVKSYSDPLKFLAESEETYWGVSKALKGLTLDKNTSKILEIGSGLGYLTYSLINANYNVIGLDISKTAVKNAIDNFGPHYICADLFEYAERNLETFDVVILTEVIEHVEKPLEFLKAIMKVLKPGGNAIITTPNKTIFPLDTIWASDLPPVHCWWFSERSFGFMASELNAKLDFVNFQKYYKCNPSVLKPQKGDIILPNPIFNTQYELIISAKSNKVKKFGLLRKVRTSLSKISLLRNTYYKLKKHFNPELIFCKNKGIVLCGIFRKI